MRRLMYVSLGFGVACGLRIYIEESWMQYAAANVVILLLCLVDRKQAFWKKLLLSFLGCVMGFFWFSQFQSRYLEPILPLDEQTATLTIRASDFGVENRGFTFVDGTVNLDGKTYLVHTRLKGSVAAEPGSTFQGNYRIHVSEDSYNAGYGSFLYAYQQDKLVAYQGEPVWFDRIAVLRREIKLILKNTFPEDTDPFAKALLLGDTSDLSYKVDTDLKVSGVRHVVAVSGLHISILFGLVSMMTFRKRFLTALLGFPLLFFFAALTGFSPSVSRSCLMFSLVLMAKLSDREYDGPTALGFAALVMLALNPYVMTTVGFQLSVASVTGIYLFTPGIIMWLRSFFGAFKRKTLRGRLIRWSTTSVGLTLGAMVLTTPLCAYYFGMVSLVGVVTNLLALWVVSGIFYGIMAVCLLYGLVPAAAAVLANVIAWPIRYVLWVAETLADFPLAAVYTVSPYITAWLVFVYVLLAVFLISRNRRPRILSCCAALGLCLALTADWVESASDEVRITVLDVGQGQSILLQSEGRSFLVDCGGDSATEAADRAAEELLHQGIGKLDGLVLTHMDEDHAGGAEGLLSRMDTELLFLPEEFSELPETTNAQAICVTEEVEIAFGETVIRLFPATFPGNSNEKSVCVLFDTKKCDILVTGDRDGFGERALLRNAQIPDVDILIAGHHGSGSSTCEELLAAVKPEIVCISVGAGNIYGHPSETLLQRLAAFGCEVYRTDIQGTITIRR